MGLGKHYKSDNACCESARTIRPENRNIQYDLFGNEIKVAKEYLKALIAHLR
jgi:hypothetical protein